MSTDLYAVVEVPPRLAAKHLHGVVTARHLRGKNRCHPTQATGTWPEIFSTPDGRVRGPHLIAELHPGLVGAHPEVVATPPPETQLRHQVGGNVQLIVATARHEPQSSRYVLEPPLDPRPCLETGRIEARGDWHAQRQLDRPARNPELLERVDVIGC